MELRFTDPDPANAGEASPGSGTFVLDRDELLDPDDYGQALAEQLFADPEVRRAYDKARSVVEARDLELRLRLLIGPSAQNLQALRWELLTEPETQRPFATSERTLFSRFMLSRDWRPIRLRPKADLKALVAVSAPDDWEKLNVAGASGWKASLGGRFSPTSRRGVSIVRAWAGVDPESDEHSLLERRALVSPQLTTSTRAFSASGA